MRAVDTIVWGLIVIVWVGLGTFAGVIALTIHSVAALGKLFSEEIEHIDPGPVEAVTATGANLIQTIRYAVVPQIIPSFLAIFSAALGHQHALGDRHRLCGWRRDRLFCGRNHRAWAATSSTRRRCGRSRL